MSSKVNKIAIPSVKAGFLKDVFNPTDLLASPGIYTTYSDTEAYPILMAMINSELVEHIQTNYIDAIIQQPIVRVKKRKLNGKIYKSNPDPQKISIPFKVSKQVISGDQALRTYAAGWQKIWWREAIQNAKDAKANNIECGAVEQEDGTWLIWCEDNGKGMDLQTLTDAFLALGGTGGKTESGENVGGFGKAKEILLLPWIYFRVHTRDNIAYSDRATRTGEKFADITTGNKRLNGTRLEVSMPAAEHTDISYLLAFLKLCNTPGVTYKVTGKYETDAIETRTIKANLGTGRATAFSIGDEEKPASFEIRGTYQTFTVKPDGSVKTEKIPDTLLATAYIRKQPKNQVSTQELLVRDRGVFMFGLPINYEFSKKYVVFVELEVPSKFVLTENRDGWRNARLSNEVYDFIQEINRKQGRLLKEKKKLFFKKYYGEGGFAAQERKRRESEVQAAEITLSTGNVRVVTDPSGKKTVAIPEMSIEQIGSFIKEFSSNVKADTETSIATIGSETAVAMIKGTKFRGPDQLNNAIKNLVWKPNFAVKNEKEGQQPPRKFYPETMTPGVIRLAKYWTEFVRWTLSQLDIYREFNVGFVFTNDFQAMYVMENGEEWILLNPIVLSPKTKDKKTWIDTGEVMKPGNEEHLRLMYAAAIHECTHMATGLSDYDLEFPVALTYNIAKCAGFKEVKKVAKAIVTESTRKERKTSIGISATQETGLFAIAKSGRGRPKVVKTFGNPDQIQFKYMWEHTPKDGWAGLDCRLEITADNTIVYSDKANMGEFLQNLFDNWWDIRYGSSDSMEILPGVIIQSNGDRVVFVNANGNIGGVDIRSFILIINQMMEEIIKKRINFIVSQSKDRKTRQLRDEWKRVRG